MTKTDKTKKPVLPKAVLELKFMQKTKQRIQKELEDTQGHESLYSNIITNEMRSATGNFITESSFIFCEDLIEGRLSFKGMNPEIESLTKKAEALPDGEMQKDVSDELLEKGMKGNRKRHGSPIKFKEIKKPRYRKLSRPVK